MSVRGTSGDSALQERGTEGVAKESLVHGRSTPAMRHIDFIFIPDRLPRRVREEVPGLKERFHPSPHPTPDINPGWKRDPRHELNESSVQSGSSLRCVFIWQLGRGERVKNINLQLRGLYKISLSKVTER